MCPCGGGRSVESLRIQSILISHFMYAASDKYNARIANGKSKRMGKMETFERERERENGKKDEKF